MVTIQVLKTQNPDQRRASILYLPTMLQRNRYSLLIEFGRIERNGNKINNVWHLRSSRHIPIFPKLNLKMLLNFRLLIKLHLITTYPNNLIHLIHLIHLIYLTKTNLTKLYLSFNLMVLNITTSNLQLSPILLIILNLNNYK